MALQKWSFLYGFLTGFSMYTIIRWMKDKKKKNIKILESQDDCLFFSPKTLTISCIKNSSVSCSILSCPVCNYRKFLSMIKNVKKSLDICMYLITSEEVTKIIINLFKKGVFVRIIVDKQMSDEAYNSKVHVFLKEYIPINVIDISGIMHNKFVIIDQKILITGSFNWTKHGMWYNYENGLIIHNKKIIQKYSTFFQSIWLTSYKGS